MPHLNPEHENLCHSLLPVVTPLTEAGMRVKFDETRDPTQSWGEHLSSLWNDLAQNNPGLRGFIDGQLEQYPEDIRCDILNVTMGALAVLNEQMHNDALHDQTGL